MVSTREAVIKEVLSATPNVTHCISAIDELVALGTYEAVKVLENLTTHDNYEVKVYAIKSLLYLRNEDAIKLFLKDISFNSSFDRRVCDEAVVALQTINTPSALAAVTSWKMTRNGNELNLRKEDFSLAYLQAVAACAGYVVQTSKRHDRGIDAEIVPFHGLEFPKLNIQLKATAKPILFDRHGKPTSSPNIEVKMRLERYNQMRINRKHINNLLVAVVVPKDIDQWDNDTWLSQTEKSLSLIHCGYWKCLYNDGDLIPDSEGVVSIPVPRSQVFSVTKLRELMEIINKGDALC